ncbi:uncharacterized protein LOC133473675 [Phyllopteryx taeniolatus]|uniref:uncharacterized protein LOC133473675 n=1 Tax=Phyllopteryx taeniolatus TaxID=161469 RepID=UPI002AD30B0A|nr:uncharacterized protein LOC133473675 [Phyllopteryx taeniolatus]XP_061621267.1 uncharacterized protein LOC133473675 [Phyllopteryx taeniolatus]XP_061621268.1 uncharacterized protein LOC133473675 [Phyllopteryx taeniolatus]XP_061621269.1 uncharacterized protein LOC133473675 [Phyllopteryx taeniolatus]
MWGLKLACPHCRLRLTGGGLYRTVRRVLDLQDWYYLECDGCRRKYSAWEEAIIQQMSMYQQLKFPAVLTYKLACDLKVVHRLKERSLGNSVTSLRRKIQEGHTLEWLRPSWEYLSVVEQLGVPTGVLGCMRPVPRTVWFLPAFVRAVIPHLPENKDRIASVFGSLLKMDSTKKMAKKLAGAAAGTAAWVTNVGNEHGQVLMSVLTVAEGEGLSSGPMRDRPCLIFCTWTATAAAPPGRARSAIGRI